MSSVTVVGNSLLLGRYKPSSFVKKSKTMLHDSKKDDLIEVADWIRTR